MLAHPKNSLTQRRHCNKQLHSNTKSQKTRNDFYSLKQNNYKGHFSKEKVINQAIFVPVTFHLFEAAE